MRNKNQKIVFAVVIAALIGGGYYLHSMQMDSLRRTLTGQRKKVETELNRRSENGQ